MRTTLRLELPDALADFKLPVGVNARLQSLLDKQDSGGRLSAAERKEAKGLATISEFLSLLRIRAEKSRPCHKAGH